MVSWSGSSRRHSGSSRSFLGLGGPGTLQFLTILLLFSLFCGFREGVGCNSLWCNAIFLFMSFFFAFLCTLYSLQIFDAFLPFFTHILYFVTSHKSQASQQTGTLFVLEKLKAFKTMGQCGVNAASASEDVPSTEDTQQVSSIQFMHSLSLFLPC